MSNFDLTWIYNYGFIGTRLFEIPSLLICILLILFLSYKYKAPKIYIGLLLFHAFLPLIINDVLFDPSYMSDQFKYWESVNAIRSGEITIIEALTSDNNVTESSVFLSFLPFPDPVSVLSLGFYNTFIYIILFFILYAKNVFTRVSALIFLIYPSIALYSALSLRDTLIFFFMVLGITYARESKLLKSILLTFPLYMFKFQNFFILMPIILLYFLFKVPKNGMSVSKATLIFLISFVSIIIAAPKTIPLINYFRSAMYIEDGGDPNEIELISGVSELIQEGITSGIFFLSKPFLWESSGFFILIQSFENFVMLVIIFLITNRAYRTKPNKLVFWLLFLIFSMSVYGLVIFNYGTAARYRYPFTMIYILFVCADCNINQLFYTKKKTHYSVA